jgi:hypothetical protein
VLITDQSLEIVVLTLRPVIYTRTEHFTQIFDRLDTSADGELSPVEWDAFLTEELRTLGFSRAEIYNSKYLGLFSDIFMQTDTSEDSKIQVSEFIVFKQDEDRIQ